VSWLEPSLGAIAGGVLILPVYLINRFAIERMRRPSPPACVALGRNELFYERVYLDANAGIPSTRSS
jgi:hypothetical protein